MTAARSQALKVGEATTALFEDEQLLRSIAQQVARNIVPTEEIIKLHGLTNEQWITLKGNHAFNAMVVEEIAAWKDIDNTPERIKHRYQTMLELSAAGFFEALISPKHSLKDRTDLLKVIMRGANIGNDAPPSATSGGAGKVSIVINMGDAKMQFSGVPSGVTRGVDNNVNRIGPAARPDGFDADSTEDIEFEGATADSVGWLDYDGEDTPDYQYLIEDGK